MRITESLGALLKPEYLYRPRQLLLRFVRQDRAGRGAFDEYPLPWGMKIKVSHNDNIARAISHLGVYDLTVSEVLWRLIEPGETVVDVGANIGYMTALMAHRVGENGRVLTFEPQQKVYAFLEHNIKRWSEESGVIITAYAVALSNHEGTALLNVPDESDQNTGMASLVFGDSSKGKKFEIPLTRLSKIIDRNIGVLKLDVEGYEETALRGAGELLANHEIRDIVFEEHAAYPTAVTTLLESYGYSLFDLGYSFRGPKLSHIRARPEHRRWEPRSCLATVNPLRAQHRLSARSWLTLKNHEPHEA